MRLERPDERGRFAEYGGQFAPETLMPALEELEAAFVEAWADPGFHTELNALLRDFVGRPTPVYRAARLSERLGMELYLKREDLAHTGAHKINNTMGQALLTKRMGKHRVIAETGAGQHGVATATACALLGQECVVYMGEKDIERQALYRSETGYVWSGNTQGCSLGCDARLGGQRRWDPLHHRIRCRSPSVPMDGARAAEGHW